MSLLEFLDRGYPRRDKEALMKITVISGSHRVHSQSERVSGYIAAALAPMGVAASVVSLSNNPLPLWDEGVWGDDPKWSAVWGPISSALAESDAFVFVTPEWAGMVPPGLKNFLLLCSTRDVGHKPALIVSISSGVGGSYPVAELRMSSYKNNRLVYIPDHVILRDVEALFVGDSAQGERDASARARLMYSLQLLVEYGKALAAVRASGVINNKEFPFGL